jgi:hypothetical protein
VAAGTWEALFAHATGGAVAGAAFAAAAGRTISRIDAPGGFA